MVTSNKNSNTITRIIKQCQACRVDFQVPKYRENTAKYCSDFCHKQLRFQTSRTAVNCSACQKEIKDSPSRKERKFCSVECRESGRMSDKEKRAKGKALQKLRRGNNSSRTLRNWVFKVKEPQCQVCGYNKRKYCIDLHHIDNNPNNNTLENIAILCVMCHRELHQGDLEHAVEKGLVPENSLVQHKRA